MISIPIISREYKWIFSNVQIEELFISGNVDPSFKNQFIFRAKYIIFFYICVETLFRSLFYFIKQFSVSVVLDKDEVSTIILGSGKDYGSSNIHKIFDINPSTNVNINAFHLNDYMENGRVGALSFGKNILSAIFDYHTALSFHFPDEVVSLMLKQAASYITRYSYLRTQFSLLHRRYPGSVVYTDIGSLPSHAAISSGFKTIHFYHGLMGSIHLNTFPDYYSIYVYSQDEKDYLSKVGIDSEVYIYPSKTSKHKNNNVVFFMPADIPYHFNPKIALNELTELFYLFKRTPYKIFIKFHPLCYVNDSFSQEYKLNNTAWDKILDLVQEYSLISGSDASAILNKLNPTFIVGMWGSTVLCEGLNSGVIPINIFRPDKEMSNSTVYKNSYIYKTNKRSLSWPLDSEVINSVLNIEETYNDTMNKLRAI
jgi:hypothetical protein